MSLARHTDLYEVTMALSYLEKGMTAPATFSLFTRALPPERGFLVSAGLASVLDHVSDFRIGKEDVEWFADALGRPQAELEPLRGLEFRGEVRAVPEGRVVLAGEPLLEVTAPLPMAQLLETFLLNQITYQTAIASKAARCVLAAAGRPLIDFSMRRTHGLEAAHQAARACGLVGFAGTSNIPAARRFAIPAVGTMAHSYIQAFVTEQDAFRAFARTHAGPLTLLVDTYDTDSGTRSAVRVLRELEREAGAAIRIDSGNLGALASRARGILDASGLPQVRIIASGGLDEYAVAGLVRSGAPIDVYAVGTRIGVSADAPYLDTAYKLVEYDGRPVMKLSASKVTAPGRKQVFRQSDQPDVVALRDEKAPSGSQRLLETVMCEGEHVVDDASLARAHGLLRNDLGNLPSGARRIENPAAPRPVASRRLASLTDEVRERIQRQVFAESPVRLA